MPWKWIEKFLPKATPVNDQDTPENYKHDPEQVASRVTVDAIFSAIAQAESGNMRDLFTIYRDAVLSGSHLQAEFAKRKLAVLNKPLAVIPWDKNSDDDKAAAEAFYRLLDTTPNWTLALSHMLDSILWPVSVVEKVFRTGTGRYRFELDRLVNVPHHLLDCTAGELRILTTHADGSIGHGAKAPDPNRYIVHRGHLLSMPDKFGGPMRAILFWWLFSLQGRDWWMRFLQRFGSPFMVGRYPRGDTFSRRVLQRAFVLSQRLFGLALPDDVMLELKEATAASGDAFEKMHTFANREISKLVIGQTLSAEAQPTGLGSGVAGIQGDVRDDFRKFDAAVLAQTIRDQLIVQIHKINGLPGSAPYVVFGSQHDAGDMLSTLKGLSEAGLRPSDSAAEVISERVGFQVERAAALPPVPMSADHLRRLRSSVAALSAGPR